MTSRFSNPGRFAGWNFMAFALVALACWSIIQPAAAQNRMALIIGNADYSFAPLRNPVNDAVDMEQALRQAGFAVTLVTNASRQRMQAAVDEFSARLSDQDIALFYFSGHGVQIEDRNYLIPVNADLRTQQDAKEQSLDMAAALAALNGSGVAASIVILDACRNNPLPAATRSLTRGLARQTSTATGTFISFSTSPGAVALDGEGRNSPYTKNLVTAITTPGLSLEETFKRTLKAVHEETKGVQTPWISSSFFGDFTFIEGEETQTAAVEPDGSDTAAATEDLSSASRESSKPNPADVPKVVEGTYDVRGTNPDGSRYRGVAYLSRIGDSWRFEWLIAGQTFVGVGEFVGEQLSIEWGDSNPVVYDIPKPGVLDGRWGTGGRGTDVLVLKSPLSAGSATDAPAFNLVGKYTAQGRNPDGSRYQGTVAISKEGEIYHFQWWIGNQTYRGKGTLSDGVLTVDWGDSQPVIYQVMADGALKGTWAGGKASENLRKN